VSRFRPDLPQPLIAAIEKCLAKAPEERFASGEALVESLEQVRGRQVNVAPAIRVWTVRADQFFRNGLLLALIMPQILRFSNQTVAALFSAVMFAIVVPALWAQIPVGMRELARQGFAYGDLRAGILAIDAERQAVIAAQDADPRYRSRRRRRGLILLGTFVLAILTIVGMFALGEEVAPGQHKMPFPALVTLFIALCVAMACIVFGAAMVSSSGRMDRRMHRLWTGKVGKQLYRLATWRLGGVTAPSVTQGSHGALTLLDALPAETRRKLGKTRVVLERLEGELERLERRDIELEAAASEAKAGGSSGRQQELLADLERARRETAEKRVALLSALENVRLALVRVKSRIGGSEDVERELNEATRLLQG
jgi:hypothetical protein